MAKASAWPYTADVMQLSNATIVIFIGMDYANRELRTSVAARDQASSRAEGLQSSRAEIRRAALSQSPARI
jgi:hypothetical protein